MSAHSGADDAPAATVLVDGSPVRVLRTGSGPAVLMLHGSGPGTTADGAWAQTAVSLASSWTVVAPDQAGFGRTPLPPEPRGRLLTMWADQAAGVMDALGHESYAVVGHSMGGAVALALAAALPDRVTHVVAVATMGTPDAPLSEGLDAVWDARPGLSGAEGMLRRLLHDPARVSAQAVLARSRDMEAGASTYAHLFPPPRGRWVEELTLSPGELSGIRAPVLLVHGAQDVVTPLGTAALPLLEALADVRLHVLGRCGHAPPVEHPEAFQRLLAEFLRL